MVLPVSFRLVATLILDHNQLLATPCLRQRHSDIKIATLPMATRTAILFTRHIRYRLFAKVQ
jgi:hypothetical protein